MSRFTFFFLFIFSLFPTFARAQMILPPDLSSWEAREAFFDQILKEMPSLPSERNNEEPLNYYVQRMDRLVTNLRMSEQFVEWAAERPPLQNFRFAAFHTETKDRYLITDSFLNDLTAIFQSKYEASLARDAMVFEQDLMERILGLASESAAISSQGLIAGLASVFPPERRREILAQRSLPLRASSLAEALEGVSEESLRASFQSERFGIARERLTKREAINLLNESVARELELIQTVSLLEMHARTGELSADTIRAENIGWFNGEGNLEFLEDFGLAPATITTIERLRANARGSFTSILPSSTVAVEDASIIVREVPAHLAIFRGCAGGDCSTTNSWAYSFSPKERTFYIYIEGLEFQEIGYVSGTITRVRGRDALFLRDLTGKRMAPEHIDMLIQGFAQLLDAYGVDQMTIAHPDFHSKQNHFPPLYTRINQIIGHLDAVEQQFPDAELRVDYIDQFVTSPHYDRPSAHALVMLYDAEKVNPHTRKVKVERLPADYFDIALARKPTGRDILLRLRMALLGDDPSILEGSDYIRHRKWSDIRDIWFNQTNVSIEKHYARVGAELARMNLSLSRSLIRRFSSLFFQGHMSARNAFTTDDPELLELGYRMVIDRYFRHDENQAIFASRDLRLTDLFKHPEFLRLIKQGLERQRPQDWARVRQLLRLEFVFDFPMTKEQVDALLAVSEPIANYRTAPAILRTLFAQGWRDNYSESVLKHATQRIGWSNDYRWVENPLKESLPIVKVLAQIEIDPRQENNIKTLESLISIAFQYREIEIGFLAAVTVLRAKHDFGSQRTNQVADFVEQALSGPINGQTVSEESKEIGRPVLESYRRAQCADKVAS